MSEQITLNSGEVLDLAAYPLPDGILDEVFNLDLMAQAMNTSTVTIRKWIGQGMPVLQKGGNGASYELSFHHCWAWRKWRDGEERAALAAKTDRANQLALMFLGEDQPDDKPKMSPKEIKEWSEAEMLRNKAAEQRGQLVRVSDVEAMLERLLIAVRTAVMNAPDYLEQEFGLNARQVDKAQEYFDAVLDDMRHQIGRSGYEAGTVLSFEQEIG